MHFPNFSSISALNFDVTGEFVSTKTPKFRQQMVPRFPYCSCMEIKGNEQKYLGSHWERKFPFPLWEIIGNVSVFQNFAQQKCSAISGGKVVTNLSFQD